MHILKNEWDEGKVADGVGFSAALSHTCQEISRFYNVYVR